MRLVADSGTLLLPSACSQHRRPPRQISDNIAAPLEVMDNDERIVGRPAARAPVVAGSDFHTAAYENNLARVTA